MVAVAVAPWVALVSMLPADMRPVALDSAEEADTVPFARVVAAAAAPRPRRRVVFAGVFVRR